MFDTDNSGTLSFEEIMYFYSALCDGAARLIIKVGKLTYFKVINFSLSTVAKFPGNFPDIVQV